MITYISQATTKFIRANHPYYKNFNPTKVQVSRRFRVGQLAGAAIKAATTVDPVEQLQNADDFYETLQKLKDECKWGVYGL